MARGFLAFLGCLIFVLYGNAQSVPSQQPEIPYAGEVPLMPNVRPVLVLSGSDHDMGYQHAQQLIQIYGTYYMKGAASVTLSENQLASLRNTDALFKKHAPWIADYVKGIADGATAAGLSMTYEQALAQFAGGRGSEGASEGQEKIAAALPHGEAPRKMASLYVLAAAIMRCGSDRKRPSDMKLLLCIFRSLATTSWYRPPQVDLATRG